MTQTEAQMYLEDVSCNVSQIIPEEETVCTG